MDEKGNVMIAVVVALVIGAIGGYVMANTKSASPSTSTMKESVMMQTSSQGMNASSTLEEKIANAMSAAPENVSKDATVLDWPAAGGKDFTTLRTGTNGWTCIPDFPTTPGNDPVCVDGEAMKFFQAWMSHTKPKLAQAGLSYMLQGGSDPSNTDPYATAPAAGEDWMHAPPHLMIFTTTPPDPKVYGTNPDSGGPWVMWANTAYAHLMVPVK